VCSSMGDGRLRSPSLWDDINPPSFPRYSPPSPSLVARNLSFTHDEIIDSRLGKGDHPSIEFNHYRSDLVPSARSRRPRVVVRKFPLSVIVKRQCAVLPLEPPTMRPLAAAPGAWSPAKVLLRISESEGDQSVETDAWAFHEHDPPLGADLLEDERHPHLMESSADPSLFSPSDYGDHDEDVDGVWPSWDVKDEPADMPEAPEDLQCPLADLEPADEEPVAPILPMEPLEPIADCFDTDAPMSEVVERSLVFHGEELAQPARTIDTGYPCPEKNCQSVLATLTALRKHRLVHAPKIFACSMCDRAFAERTKLNRHERSHTGEKPYKCPVTGCGKVFAHNFNLNSHLKLHNDERPFVCGVCGRSFAKNSNLRVHAVTHSRPKLVRKSRKH
ncbi:hypothetical protein PMAYCL1PPCAC_26775, partial [Pristionchus mayeri]